jgi:AraC-like DNA-binding protein
MPGSSTNRFIDADDYRLGLADIFAAFTVTAPGAFAAHATRITLRHLHLLRAREALSRVAVVALPQELVFISFSADPALPLVWRGVALDADEIMLHSRGEKLHQRTNGASTWGCIALSPSALAGFCATETGGALALPERGQILRPSASDRQNLLRVHGEAARLAQTRPRVLEVPAVVRAMEYELAGYLINCLTNNEVRIEGPVARQGADSMMRFEDLLMKDPHRGVKGPELCRHLGVAERSLHNYCRTFLGVTARRYGQLRRLQLVRAAILHADPREARISVLAREAGFTEPGRFAGLYRAIYGEAPSATLRRAGEA